MKRQGSKSQPLQVTDTVAISISKRLMKFEKKTERGWQGCEHTHAQPRPMIGYYGHVDEAL